MRVLILGPVHAGGSLPPYLDALAAGLAGHGVTAVRAGSDRIPYDQARQEFWPPDRVAAAARALARETDPGAFDLVALNAGNLEYDQLVPAIWAAGGQAVPPLVHHVHALGPTLFRDHAPDPRWHRAARDAVRDAGGHVWFGQYARRQMAGRAAPPPRAAPTPWPAEGACGPCPCPPPAAPCPVARRTSAGPAAPARRRPTWPPGTGPWPAAWRAAGRRGDGGSARRPRSSRTWPGRPAAAAARPTQPPGRPARSTGSPPPGPAPR